MAFSVKLTLTNGAGQQRWATAFSKTTGETWLNGEGLYFETSDSTLRFWVGKYNVAPCVMSFPIGTTARIVATWDGTNARLYKNGVQAITSKPTEIATTGTVQFGGAPGGYTWAGAITNTAFIDGRALTAQEVADDYTPPIPPPPTGGILSPDSQWRRKLPVANGTDVFYDGQTNDICAYVTQEIAKERAANQGPWLATSNSSSYVWIVPPDAPLRKVQVNPALNASWRKPLQAVFDSIPIPDGVYTTTGDDALLTLYQPSTDRLWEIFWYRQPGEYGDPSAYASCHWGGATQNASKSRGVYDYDSWPPWSRPHWGGTAGSHVFAAGLITMAELAAGVIPHAIAVDFGKMKAGIVTHPAFRTDGLNFDQYSVPYGAHFRLAPEVNLDAVTFATPLAKMIAKAIQDYGMIARNQTGGGFTLFCEDPRPSGNATAFWDANGNPSPTGYLQGMMPPQALDGIPWDSLLLLDSYNHQQTNMTMAVRGDLMDSTRVKMLEHMVGKNTWTKPAQVYVALFKNAPRHDIPDPLGSPYNITIELSGPGYGRASAPANSWGQATATGTNVYIQNSQTLTFPTPSGSWGTPEAVGIYDAQTGGNLIAFGWIPASLRKPITTGQPVSLPAGALWFQDVAITAHPDLSVG